MPNNAYSLWRANDCQQGFGSVGSFDFGGQESASKPPQAIFKPLGFIRKRANSTNSTFGFCQHFTPSLKKPKEQFLANANLKLKKLLYI